MKKLTLVAAVGALLGFWAVPGAGEDSARSVTVNSAASGPLVHSGVVQGPVDQVWQAFTTKAGIESWMVPHAEIDLKIGGKMRTNYNKDGTVDDSESIENTILSYDPPRMLSIQATRAPAGFPYKNALKSMWTVIYFEELTPDRTTVTVVGHGFDESEESRKMRDHFDRGNAYTVRKLQERFAKTAEAGDPARD